MLSVDRQKQKNDDPQPARHPAIMLLRMPRAAGDFRVARHQAVGRMGFGPTYVAHIPPLEGWYSRDSLCYGVGARMMYIMQKCKFS